MDESVNLVYGVDYDYVIESFYCEYKLDKDGIKKVLNNYTFANTEADKRQCINELAALWPEYPSSDIDILDLSRVPDTVVRKIYFIQSPKGADGLPTIHYSLKEKMLSDLRATRNRVKKELANAEKSGDHVGAIRFNAKQLAIKVVCNSEYGASNNEFFAHYDPDIAAAVTFGSRQLIGFLTCNLESDHIFVTKKFIDDNRKHIDLLQSIGCLNISDKVDRSKLFTNRRHAQAILFDSNYNVVEQDIYDINIQKSTVVYQDTDSNYYINKYIIEHHTNNYTSCSPEIIDACMKCMLSHNILLAGFIKDAINRRPASLGFEGSFIVCRYLNRKKKYYGIKWSEDGSKIPATKLCDAAYEDDVLIDDYTDYWSPKKYVLPRPNGEYLYLDTDALLHKGVNYLDYVHDYNVKCTGVDLARRDQYKYINYFHMLILQQDLRIMKYIGSNNWEVVSLNAPMQQIVEGMLDLFREIMDQYKSIANFTSSVTPKIEFKAIDFAKTAAYRPGKLNTVSKIVKRLQKENKEQYIPSIGERMSYIVILDDITKEERLNGKAGTTCGVSEKSFVIDELIDDIKKLMPEREYIEKATSSNLIDSRGRPIVKHDAWINAKIIAALDTKYYLECLCKSTALYMIGDIYSDEIRRIDEGMMSASDANKLITKLQGNIAKEYVKRYFHYGVSLMGAFKETEKNLKKWKATIKEDDANIVFQVCPSIKRMEDITPRKRDAIITTCEKQISNLESGLDDVDLVYKTIMTNCFSIFEGANENQKHLYEKYKNNTDKLLEQKMILGQRLYAYQHVKRIVASIKFVK